MTPEKALEKLGLLLAQEPDLLEFLARLSRHNDLLLKHLAAGDRATLRGVQRDLGSSRADYLAVLARTLLVERIGFRDGVVDSALLQGVRVGRTTAQSINNATDTDIIWDLELFDTDDMWNSANPERITFRTPGVYAVGASCAFAPNGVGDRRLQLTTAGSVNGTHSTMTVPAASVNVRSALTAMMVYKAERDDTVVVNVHQSSGGALNVTTTSSNSLPNFWAKRTS